MSATGTLNVKPAAPAGTLSFPAARPIATVSPQGRLDAKGARVWKRVAGALARLQFDSKPTATANAYAYAFRTLSVPRDH